MEEQHVEEQYVKALLDKYKVGTITDEEKAVLDKWYLTVSIDKSEELSDEDRLEAFDNVMASLYKVVYQKNIYPLWSRIAVAASLVICLSVSGFFLLHSHQAKQISKNQPIDIQSGSKKAILILSTGTQITLSDAKEGTLAKQGSTTVSKTSDGQVVYSQNDTANTDHEIVYNTITTPRAGYYSLRMSDGTFAILDAESSIKYPVEFNGKDRTVEITGQVYFEVTYSKEKPFRVKVKGQTIEDLGTHFNINAYDDETVLRTTLVEGRIRVYKNASTAIIKPGQQAITKPTNDDITIKEVNTDDAVAWKNGQTSFQNENIEEIMRQVSRWYNVDVKFEGNLSKRLFNGGIARNASLSDLIKILQFNGVNCILNGNTLVVKQ